MSLRERVRLLRKELCDEVVAELDRLEAEIVRLNAELAESRVRTQIAVGALGDAGRGIEKSSPGGKE